MKYRTLLTDPSRSASRPTQAFHTTQTSARQWATAMLAGASPLAYVTLYVEVEVEVYQWKQDPPPAPASALSPTPPEANE
jgi:hypothetical protein